MWLIALPPNRPPRQGTYLLDGFLVVPREVVVEGQKAMGLYVPDDHPTAAGTRAMRLPGYRLVEDTAVKDAEPPPAPPAPTQQQQDAVARQAIYVEALRRGWTGDDLEGTWDGTAWTDRDDRSPRTGLTLLEHAQTRPPKDWGVLQPMGRAPWASTDWADPVKGWVPPAWTSPVREADETRPSPSASDVDDDSPTTMFETSAVDAEDATVLVDDPSVEGEFDPEPEPGDAAVSVEYPEEMTPRAQEIVSRLVGRYGRGIKLGRINAELRKAGLQTLTLDAQVDWLLTLPPTT